MRGAIVAGVKASKSLISLEAQRLKTLASLEIQRLVDSKDPTAVCTGLFIEFATGLGPAQRRFESDSVMAEHMKDAPGVLAARDYFYRTRAQDYLLNKKTPGVLARKSLLEYSAGFNPVLGPINAGTDIVEQFIGNFKVEIFPNLQGTQMTIVCTNATSLHSLLYHLPFAQNREREEGLLPSPWGTIRQVITWDEPIENSRFEANLNKKAANQ